MSYGGYKSITEQLDQAKQHPRTAGGARKKKPSGHGDGKWQTLSSLAKYRKKRNAARKLAKRSRRG